LPQLRLGETETLSPEPSEHRARGREQVATDGAGRRALAEPRDRLHGDLLGEVFGVRPVADPRVDERVDKLELVERDVCGAPGDRKLDNLRLLAGRLVR